MWFATLLMFLIMLTQDEVQHIALLARIGITEEEREKYQKDLARVLDFFHELKSVVTEQPAIDEQGAEVSGVVRTDRAESFDVSGRETILKNVPATKDGFVKVKSVF